MANWVFITGDTHGEEGITRFAPSAFPEGNALGKNDYVIILGDFRFPWVDPKVERDKYWLDWLQDKPWTTLVVDGNHENHDLLDSMDEQSWHGGEAHFLRPSVIHLTRGQVFEIAGRTFFVMRGADSTDKAWRVSGGSWWEREMPS